MTPNPPRRSWIGLRLIPRGLWVMLLLVVGCTGGVDLGAPEMRRGVVFVEDAGGPRGCAGPATCVKDYLAAVEQVPDLKGPHPLPVETLRAQILRALGVGPLLAGLTTRTLIVRTIRDGDLRSERYRAHLPPMRERDVVLVDPVLGAWDAIVLNRRDAPANGPGLILVPGHTEDAAFARDELFGAWFASLGYTVLIPTNRGNDAGPNEDRVTRTLLEQGTTFQGLRVIEILRAKQALAAMPEVDPKRIGLFGHSGGSTTNNLVVHVDPSFAALISDLETMYEGSNVVDGRTMLLEEYVPALTLLAPRIHAESPVPTRRVRYGDGPGPRGRDFFARHLRLVPPSAPTTQIEE